VAHVRTLRINKIKMHNKTKWFFVSLTITLCISHCTAEIDNLLQALQKAIYDDSNKKYFLNWNVDNSKIQFNVKVSTIGFTGFGISNHCISNGSNIFIAGVESQTKNKYFSEVCLIKLKAN